MLSAAARYTVWWTALLAVVLLPLAYLPAHPTINATSHRAAPVKQTTPASLSAPIARAPLTPLLHPAPAARLRFPLVLTVVDGCNGFR